MTLDFFRKPLYVLSLLSLSLLSHAFATPPSPGDVISDRQATLLAKITEFITYPEEARIGMVMTIAVYGTGQFADYVQRTPLEVGVFDRFVRFVVVNDINELEKYPIVYFEKSVEAQIPKILLRLKEKPILTLSGTPGFVNRGVMINLIVEKSHITIEINQGSVQKSSLRVSAKLFKIAKIVRS